MANVQEHFVRVLVLMTKPVERIAGTVLARLNDDQYGQYVKAAANGLAPKCGDDLYCILDEVYTAFYDEYTKLMQEGYGPAAENYYELQFKNRKKLETMIRENDPDILERLGAQMLPQDSRDDITENDLFEECNDYDESKSFEDFAEEDWEFDVRFFFEEFPGWTDEVSESERSLIGDEDLLISIFP